MSGLRYQFYRAGDKTTVEFYRQHKQAECSLYNRKLSISFDGTSPVTFELVTPARLLGSHSAASGRKFVVELATEGPQKYNIFADQRQIDSAARYAALDAAGAKDEPQGVGAALRGVYERADERTKEAMVRSYYESGGRVVSSTWDE